MIDALFGKHFIIEPGEGLTFQVVASSEIAMAVIRALGTPESDLQGFYSYAGIEQSRVIMKLMDEIHSRERA